MHRSLTITLCCLLLQAAPAPASEEAAAPEVPDAFQTVVGHYEAMRQSLIRDSAEGIAEHARAIAEAARGLQDDLTAERARVPARHLDAVRELLPGLVAGADAVAGAEDLAASRAAFYELSKPLVRWREHAGGARPVVAYCSMANKSWLQPDEPLGNPYYGTSMLRCGTVVSR